MLDYEQFKGKLGKWAPLFKKFIESDDMEKIYQTIREDAQRERIVPNSANTFRAFSTTDPDNIRCIWFLMDPYPRLYKDGSEQATGLT